MFSVRRNYPRRHALAWVPQSSFDPDAQTKCKTAHVQRAAELPKGAPFAATVFIILLFSFVHTYPR